MFYVAHSVRLKLKNFMTAATFNLFYIIILVVIIFIFLFLSLCYK